MRYGSALCKVVVTSTLFLPLAGANASELDPDSQALIEALKGEISALNARLEKLEAANSVRSQAYTEPTVSAPKKSILCALASE